MSEESRVIYPRPCGLETEFGMTLKGEKALSAGPLFVGRFRPGWFSRCVGDVEWDATARIKQDPNARGDHAGFDNLTWRRECNFLLGNGARFYLDGGHAEISTPLCLGPRELLRWNRACYSLIDQIREKYKTFDGREFRVYRNNVAMAEIGSAVHSYEGDRVSFACHEDYTSRRDIPLDTFIQRLGFGLFPARVPIIGAGKVGADCNMQPVDFQMSQRADFLVRTYSIATTHDRPIYNTRDVPYADPRRFRRIHVIAGDSNMLPIPEFLKVAITDIALRMIEDGVLGRQFEFLDPVRAMKEISRDFSFTKTYAMAHDKRQRGVLDILREYRDCFGDYISTRWQADSSAFYALEMFSWIIDRLAMRDEESLIGTLDWVTKKHMIQEYVSKKCLDWKSFTALQLDCEYSNNDHVTGRFYRHFPNVEKEFFTHEERVFSEHHPPDSRSRWIMEIIRRYGSSISSSNYWCTIIAHDPLNEEGWRFIIFSDPLIRYDQRVADEVCKLSFQECIRAFVARGMAEIRPSEYDWYRGERLSDDYYARSYKRGDRMP